MKSVYDVKAIPHQIANKDMKMVLFNCYSFTMEFRNDIIRLGVMKYE